MSFDRLPLQYRAMLVDALVEHDVFVIYSFQTPIVWQVLDGTNEWTYPDVKYTPTTSGHQSRVVAAIKAVGSYTLKKV